MSLKHILAVDVGTQSLKASVIDENLNTVERRKVPYTPQTHSGNCVEIDVNVLWDAFITACRNLKNKEVEGITFSTLCPSLLLMAENGAPLSQVILHLDRRSQKQSDWIVENIGLEKFRSITGNPPIPGGISVTSMLWLKESLNNKLPENSVFGHVITYFMKRLTGRFLIEPSNASFTGLYETLEYSDWSDELIKLSGIDRKHLPDLLDSTEVAGYTDKEIYDLTGIKEGTPVIIGANDTTCAVAGAGICDPGMLLNTSGTVEILVMCSGKPVVSPNHLIRTHAYRDRWLMMRTLGAGGASIEWFRKNFCSEMSYDSFYDDFFAKVLDNSDSNGVAFAPYLTGDRHRLEKLTATFSNITLDSTREDFLHALVTSNVDYLMSILGEWEQICEIEGTIYHVGGGAGDAYTAYKQSAYNRYNFINIGETAERGSAQIGFNALGIEPKNITTQCI